MMKSIYVTFLTLTMISFANAAIEIQIQDSGEQSLQYFGDGRFLLVSEYRYPRPSIGVPAASTVDHTLSGQVFRSMLAYPVLLDLHSHPCDLLGDRTNLLLRGAAFTNIIGL